MTVLQKENGEPQERGRTGKREGPPKDDFTGLLKQMLKPEPPESSTKADGITASQPLS